MEKEIRITNNLDEIGTLAEFIEELGAELSLSMETTMHINLALEEAVSNIIMYAYPQEEAHEIILKTSATENQLIFFLTDNGLSFDPTSAPEVNLDIPAEERQIGGLGIFLIRRIMNEVTYRRLDGENHLTMKKNL
ncbi:ATP-binding protein [Bacteroides sp.]|uniref:ATP-binding protein n=1 Tax=Bacteroides sp. TaxID=29523 RepID=UPI0026252D92|nr:ATP-binding protein [Bacteroides sp.]